MTPAARLSAAIEVLDDIATRRRPAADALKDWGLARRFAGSKDRAAVASLVYDALRRRASASWIMGADGSRAVLLGMLALQRDLTAHEIAGLCAGERHAPAPLSDEERRRLDARDLSDAPAHVIGDYPEWLHDELALAFAADLTHETGALSARAPLDLRVNALKCDREEAARELVHLQPRPTPLSPLGLRLTLSEDGRGPAVHAEPAFLKGLVEVQDEGSQVVAALALAQPGEQVVDLCAGAGGKTLALAAAMSNRGQLFATDIDARRLKPLWERIERAGARNVQVRLPRGGDDPLADLAGEIDLVMIDAPCTGVGVWRRNPDAKWRVRPGALAQRVAEQDAVLDRAERLLKPGGRIAYVTCSLLPAENDARIAAALARHTDLAPIATQTLIAQAAAAGALDPAGAGALRACATRFGLLLTPRRTGTDGFYMAALRRGF